jgi:hypothetical protein
MVEAYDTVWCMVDARFGIGVGAWLMHCLVQIDVHVHG